MFVHESKNTLGYKLAEDIKAVFDKYGINRLEALNDNFYMGYKDDKFCIMNFDFKENPKAKIIDFNTKKERINNGN